MQAEALRDLTDGGGLARAVDTDDQQDAGGGGQGQGLRLPDHVGHDLAEGGHDLVLLLETAVLDAGAKFLHDLLGGGKAHVGRNQDFFQLLQKILIHLGEGLQEVVYRGKDGVTGLGQARLQTAPEGLLGGGLLDFLLGGGLGRLFGDRLFHGDLLYGFLNGSLLGGLLDHRLFHGGLLYDFLYGSLLGGLLNLGLCGHLGLGDLLTVQKGGLSGFGGGFLFGSQALLLGKYLLSGSVILFLSKQFS